MSEQNVVPLLPRSFRDLPPGSLKAVSYGCLCPETDNHYGKGWRPETRPGQFITDARCTIHGRTADTRGVGG